MSNRSKNSIRELIVDLSRPLRDLLGFARVQGLRRPEARRAGWRGYPAGSAAFE
jgi:hypothetical protein